MLKNKRILLGITGSIAAYKAAYLTRLLVKAGAEVKIVITPYGKEFITPVTLATLSKNTVLSDFFHHDDGAWNSHVELGLWADIFLIAPASANTLAKMAQGVCDNLLLTTYLSVRCPVMVAPAMDTDMYAHPATQQNIEILRKRGHQIVEPTSGELASGLTGKGRMSEPESIITEMENFFASRLKLAGKKILITAGPTYEALDPVRFIGNHSSGKMGFAIANELASRGAEVVLVSGPVSNQIIVSGVKLIRVTTSQQMFDACKKEFPSCDAGVMAAAVSDYRPAVPFTDKIKDHENQLQIVLTPTEDIAAEMGRMKTENQVLIGFALETSNEIDNARKKLVKKNLDMIVLNSLNDDGAGFGFDTNKISILYKDNIKIDFQLKHKNLVAKDIVDEMVQLIK